MRDGLLLGRMLLPVLALARRHGIGDVALERIGIDAERLAALETMVPGSRVYALVAAVAARTDVEGFAIAVATATQASDLGLVGVAMRAAPTARSALALLVRYQAVVNTVASFEVREADGEATLVEERHGPAGLGRAIASEIAAMTNIHWGRMLLGAGFAPSRVMLPRRAQFPAYARWAGCPVAGGAVRASVSFPAALLDRPVATADGELWRFFGDLLRERAGAAASATSLVPQLRREIVSVLCEGAPPLEEIARRLGEAPRTLQRRLAAEGVRYSSVLDGLRHELALAHLAKGELAIAEIAFALGFDEVASFHRAFRRWEKTTPARYRLKAQPTSTLAKNPPYP